MRKIYFLVMLGIVSLGAMAQSTSPELISSAGDNYANSNVQMSWSIGECVISTHAAGNCIITQGFHQSNYDVVLIEDLAKDMNISVYPNPTTGLISIDMKSFTEHLNTVIISDIKGNMLKQAELKTKNSGLDLSAYANGIYFLSLRQDNQLIKTFKIIKN